jgi:hypothetical protein
MVKATELRLFNQVSWKGSINTIVAIEFDQDGEGYFVTLSDHVRGGIATVNIKDIDHIPLNTEWLERMGCVVTKFEGEDAALVDIPGLFMAVPLYTKTHSLKPVPAPKARPLRFVHEFQNFYLDLTGEELTIKETV